MILQINKHNSLRTFQQQFNTHYPFLKIEFFKKIPSNEPLNKINISLEAKPGKNTNEFENGLFFEDHENDTVKDPLLVNLLQRDNVIITPHQAYLTKEALQEIADQTIKTLDRWQQNPCTVDACTCGKNCRHIADKHNSAIL